MCFVTLNVDCSQRSRRADIFACAASDTPVFVNSRNPQPVVAVRLFSYHSYGIGRAMLRAVATVYAICVYDTIVKVDHCYAYLD